MISEAKLKAQYKYDKENTRQVVLKLNLKNDADILNKLDAADNRQGYIKQLIRDDIRGRQEVLSIEAIKILLIPIAKRYGISRIVLFGSYARNEANQNSDVDLIIEGGSYSGLFEYMDIIEQAESALGKKVDLITRTAIEENNTESGKRFMKQIKQDEVVVYDKNI